MISTFEDIKKLRETLLIKLKEKKYAINDVELSSIISFFKKVILNPQIIPEFKNLKFYIHCLIDLISLCILLYRDSLKFPEEYRIIEIDEIDNTFQVYLYFIHSSLTINPLNIDIISKYILKTISKCENIKPYIRYILSQFLKNLDKSNFVINIDFLRLIIVLSDPVSLNNVDDFLPFLSKNMTKFSKREISIFMKNIDSFNEKMVIPLIQYSLNNSTIENWCIFLNNHVNCRIEFCILSNFMKPVDLIRNTDREQHNFLYDLSTGYLSMSILFDLLKFSSKLQEEFLYILNNNNQFSQGMNEHLWITVTRIEQNIRDNAIRTKNTTNTTTDNSTISYNTTSNDNKLNTPSINDVIILSIIADFYYKFGPISKALYIYRKILLKIDIIEVIVNSLFSKEKILQFNDSPSKSSTEENYKINILNILDKIENIEYQMSLKQDSGDNENCVNFPSFRYPSEKVIYECLEVLNALDLSDYVQKMQISDKSLKSSHFLLGQCEAIRHGIYRRDSKSVQKIAKNALVYCEPFFEKIYQNNKYSHIGKLISILVDLYINVPMVFLSEYFVNISNCKNSNIFDHLYKIGKWNVPRFICLENVWCILPEEANNVIKITESKDLLNFLSKIESFVNTTHESIYIDCSDKYKFWAELYSADHYLIKLTREFLSDNKIPIILSNNSAISTDIICSYIPFEIIDGNLRRIYPLFRRGNNRGYLQNSTDFLGEPVSLTTDSDKDSLVNYGVIDSKYVKINDINASFKIFDIRDDFMTRSNHCQVGTICYLCHGSYFKDFLYRAFHESLLSVGKLLFLLGCRTSSYGTIDSTCISSNVGLINACYTPSIEFYVGTSIKVLGSEIDRYGGQILSGDIDKNEKLLEPMKLEFLSRGAIRLYQCC